MGIGSTVPWRRWGFPIQTSYFPKQQQRNPRSLRSREASFESGRSTQLLVVEGGEVLLRDTFKSFTSSYGASERIENISDDRAIMKINNEKFSNRSHILSGPMNMIEDTPMYVASLKSSSHLQFSLLMENLGDVEGILTCPDVVGLEREILAHVGRLGALKLFHACLSRTLTAPSSADENSLLSKHFCDRPTNFPEVKEKGVVIISTGKKEGRKLKRTRASLKGTQAVDESKVLTLTISEGHKLFSKSIGRRSLIARSELEMSKAVKEVTNLEKIRSKLEENMGQPISYGRWAEAAGIDQKTLQQRLQFGWHCRDRLIRSTRSLVVYFARNYRGMGIAFDDLLQAGNMGVLKGAERFDCTKGYRFSTYVQYWIRKMMLALVARHGKGVHIPVTMERIMKRIQKARRTFYNGEGRYPQDDELAELTALPLTKVRLARNCSRLGGSLDQDTGAGWNMKFVEVAEDTSSGGFPEVAVMRRHMREEIVEVLEGLDPRERQVLVLRYGLEDGRCKSLGEIGRLCHVTKEWIRKIEKKALAKIRRDDIRTRFKCYLRLVLHSETSFFF